MEKIKNNFFGKTSQRKQNLVQRFLTTKRNASRYTQRIVHLGHHDQQQKNGQEEAENTQHIFIENEIKTSKYNLLTFLPL